MNSQISNLVSDVDPLKADSGWKDLKTDCVFKYRKIGKVVEIYVNTETINVPSGIHTIGNIPAGYRPTFSVRTPACLSGDQNVMGSIVVQYNGDIQAINTDTVTHDYFIAHVMYFVQ